MIEVSFLTDELMLDAARALSLCRSVEDVLQVLTQQIADILRPDLCVAVTVEPKGKLVYRAVTGRGANAELLGRCRDAGTGFLGWVAEHGEPLWVPDVDADLRYYKEIDEETGCSTESVYATPLQNDRQTVAVLGVINPPAQITEDALRALVETLKAFAVPALRWALVEESATVEVERYRQLFESHPDPVLVMDAAGSLLTINRAAQALPGFEELRSGDVCLPALQLSPERFSGLKKEIKHSGSTAWIFKLSLPEDDGLAFAVHISRLPSSGASSPAYYRWVARDITDLVAMEEMREQLAHMIVHDLRSPLGSILNSLDFLRSTHPENNSSSTIQVLQIAIRSARRMDRLISNILDTARLPRDGHLTITLVDVPELIRDVLEIVRSSADRREHMVVQQIQEDLPPMPCDLDIMRRVLINLLDNAVKYTPSGGTIVLTVRTDDEHFHFSVNNTGPGIPQNDQTRLFKPFARGSQQRIKGAGLGLAFCKLAIEAHNGHIWFKSRENEGATFFLTIPRTLKTGETEDEEE